jgi:hypothetical protein
MPRAGNACVACGRTFEVGESFRACLYEMPEGYDRRDYCRDCPVPASPDPVATWTPRRAAPAPKRVQRFDREAVYRFFERLDEADEPDKVQFRFVLALLLWRKKVLKLERSVTVDEREIWEFRMPVVGELHRVARPELAEEHLERLSMQVEQLLAGEPGELDATTAAQEEQTDA